MKKKATPVGGGGELNLREEKKEGGEAYRCAAGAKTPLKKRW